MTEKIFYTPDFSKQFARFLSGSHSSCFVLVDGNTLKYCYPAIIGLLPRHHIIQIPEGEENKTLQTCEVIWKKLTGANADRNSVLINFGGGVIGDMGGFAAACYKRGIAFINIPTTLLAMVDASVGGKTGIDFMGYKNQVGLFNEPKAVFINTKFLESLNERELASGFAEILKHYLVADKKAYETVSLSYQKENKPQKAKSKFSGFNWDEVVKKNIHIKSQFVLKDPFEKNVRKALNFGHTIGHAVESYFLNMPERKLLHGESVAVGILAESFISMKKELISEKELHSVRGTIAHYFNLPSILPDEVKRILELMKQDKKSEKGQLQFTLLNGIGNYSINNTVEEELISASLNY